jgi:hypothetical protein
MKRITLFASAFLLTHAVALAQTTPQVNTELPPATTTADGLIDPTTPGVRTYGYVYSGSVWDRVRFGTAGTPTTQVYTIQGIASMTPLQVTLTSNLVALTGTVPLPTGAATEATLANALTTTAYNASLGVAGTPDDQVRSVQGVGGGTPLGVTSGGVNIASEATLTGLLTTAVHNGAFGVVGTPSAQVRTVQGAVDMIPVRTYVYGPGDIHIGQFAPPEYVAGTGYQNSSPGNLPLARFDGGVNGLVGPLTGSQFNALWISYKDAITGDPVAFTPDPSPGSPAALFGPQPMLQVARFGLQPTTQLGGLTQRQQSTPDGLSYVVPGSPVIIRETARVAAADGAQTGTPIVLVDTTLRVVVFQASFGCSSDNSVKPDMRLVLDTDTTFPASSVNGVVGEVAMSDDTIAGGGFQSPYGVLAIGDADADLRYSMGAPTAGSCWISVSYILTPAA